MPLFAIFPFRNNFFVSRVSAGLVKVAHLEKKTIVTLVFSSLVSFRGIPSFGSVSEVSKKGLAGGGWRPTVPKIQQKMPPRSVLCYSQGGIGKRGQRKAWIYVVGEISLRQPPLSANPFSKLLSVVLLMSDPLVWFKAQCGEPFEQKLIFFPFFVFLEVFKTPFEACSLSKLVL